MRNPGVGLILAGLAIFLFFVLDAVFTSGIRERERNEFREKDLINPVDELPEEDPYAKVRRDILGGGDDDDFLTRDEMRLVNEGRDYTYTIRSGDSLRAIAKKYLGDPGLVKLLLEENPQLREGVPPSGTKIVIPLRHRR